MKRPAFDTLNWERILKPLERLADCATCPRDCHVDRRSGKHGYCHTGTGLSISSICAHRGEEPVISGSHGVCNIFFSHCNLQCVYCQNYDISRNREPFADTRRLEDVVLSIEATLDAGARGVGFVSPSHCLPQMQVIQNALHARGHRPTYIFNTNAYDRADIIRQLEPYIHVYLPDLKYVDPQISKQYSEAADYPQVATAAIREMFRQKGAEIELDADGYIVSGLIIRHLVLPGHVENSKAVLRFIAEELSPDIHISLMSQYWPTPNVAHHKQLGRTVSREEYDAVLEEFDRLGLWRGWIQELGSHANYRPDFGKDHPFED